MPDEPKPRQQNFRGRPLDDLIITPAEGPIRVRDDKGFALGKVSSLGACSAVNEGDMRRVRGATGSAPHTYEVCHWTGSAYAWTELSLESHTHTGPDAPGLTFLDATTFSAAAGVNVDGVFTSTYENYLLLINLSMSAANEALFMRLRASAATDANANYYWEFLNTAAGTASGAAQTAWTLMGTLGVGNTLSDGYFAAQVARPQVANETLFKADLSLRWGAPGFRGGMVAGGYNAATQFDGFRLHTPSGGGTITGTVRTYGYRSS